jgi:hypothetical protein
MRVRNWVNNIGNNYAGKTWAGIEAQACLLNWPGAIHPPVVATLTSGLPAAAGTSALPAELSAVELEERSAVAAEEEELSLVLLDSVFDEEDDHNRDEVVVESVVVWDESMEVSEIGTGTTNTPTTPTSPTMAPCSGFHKWEVCNKPAYVLNGVLKGGRCNGCQLPFRADKRLPHQPDKIKDPSDPVGVGIWPTTKNGVHHCVVCKHAYCEECKGIRDQKSPRKDRRRPRGD